MESVRKKVAGLRHGTPPGRCYAKMTINFGTCTARAIQTVMLLSVLGSFFLFANPLFAKDVTALVVLETDLDERIARFCHDHCQGNQRVGRLLRVTVHGIGPHSFTVRADASLRNRHYQDPPVVLGRRLGGGVQVYSYTIDVEAYGTLDSRTCDLTIDRIKVLNDRLGLSNLARGEEGKIHRIANCQRFLSDL